MNGPIFLLAERTTRQVKPHGNNAGGTIVKLSFVSVMHPPIESRRPCLTLEGAFDIEFNDEVLKGTTADERASQFELGKRYRLVEVTEP